MSCRKAGALRLARHGHRVAGAAALVVALAACAPAKLGTPPAPPVYEYTVPLGQTFDLAEGRALSDAEAAARLTGLGAPRLIFLGEHHADPRSQAFQVRTIRALVAAGRPVTVALEMFSPEADGALEAWRTGRLSEEDFVEQSGWYRTWGYPWRAYRDLFLLIREAHLLAHGVNVTDAERKAVGASPAAELPPALLAELGALDLTVVPHRDYLLDALREAGHDLPGGAALTPDAPMFQRMQRVQVLWDTAMGVRAARLADAAPPNGIVVAILGSGHVAHGLGANLRAARVSAVPQLSVEDTLVSKDALTPDGRARVPIGSGWVRVLAEDVALPEYPSLAGLVLEGDPLGVRVAKVSAPPGDWRAVFQVGDTIQAINREAVRSPAALRMAVERLLWNQPAEIALLRDGAPHTLAFTPTREKVPS